MLTLFFNESPVTNWEQSDRNDRQKYGRFFWELIDRNVYFPCSQFEALFLSQTHTAEMIDETIAAAAAALKNL